MNDFPVIGDLCYTHRILGSPRGKHCESLQRNLWRKVVSPVSKAVSLKKESDWCLCVEIESFCVINAINCVVVKNIHTPYRTEGTFVLDPPPSGISVIFQFERLPVCPRSVNQRMKKHFTNIFVIWFNIKNLIWATRWNVEKRKREVQVEARKFRKT